MEELRSRELAGTVELLQIDVTDEASIKAAAQEVETRHGR